MTARETKTVGSGSVSDIENILKAALPPVFGRPKIDNLLPGILSSKTLANLESQGEGPPSFLSGRRRFYARDSFIIWFVSRMQQGQDLE
jgi:hypothetical protein